MQGSKLISILSTFKPEEYKEFGRFVKSPFFNRLANVVKLYEVLKKYYPAFSHKSFTEEFVYKKIFGETEYDYFKMKILTSDFMALTEEYLAHKRFKADGFEKSKYLMEELTSRGLNKTFEKNYRKLEKKLESPAVKGEDYYYKKYHSDLLYGTYLFYKKDSSQKNNLQNITDSFLNYSLIRLIKLYTYMINEEIVYRTADKKHVLLDEIISHIREFSYEDSPALRIYFLILMLTKEDAKEYYFELKEIKLRNKEKLDMEELHNIDIVLRNFCTRMVLKGNKTFLTEYFDMLKSEVFDHTQYKANYLSHFRFMNAVITSLRLKDTEWAENFIRDYQYALQPEYKDEMVSLTTSMLLFANNNFDEALTEINKIKFEDCHHKMHLRNLTLQIYYELDYFEPAISIIDSYKHFLAAEKFLSEIYRTYNINFLKYYAELLKIKMEDTDTEAGELEFRLAKIPEFANKDWILEKINELQK